MGGAGTAVAIAMFVTGVFLLGIATRKLIKVWSARIEPPVEHISRAKAETWQSRHREALDRPRRIPSRHQADPSAPAARQSRARMTRRIPGQ